MRYILSILVAGVLALSINAQQIERKLIIQGGNYYFTTIDENLQIGTLHTGSVTSPLKDATHIALPAGRNYSGEHNPFSWDISDEHLYVINFLDHPLNDRNEAIKKILIEDLIEWNDSFTVMDMIMRSVEENMLTYNDPYLFTIRRSNILQGFYFDAILAKDEEYTMVITNNQEFMVWTYSDGSWDHGPVLEHPVDGFFSLITSGDNLYLFQQNGAIFEVSKTMLSRVPGKSLDATLDECILIENRDNNTISYIKEIQLDKDTPLKDLLENKAKQLY